MIHRQLIISKNWNTNILNVHIKYKMHYLLKTLKVKNVSPEVEQKSKACIHHMCSSKVIKDT